MRKQAGSRDFFFAEIGNSGNNRIRCPGCWSGQDWPINYFLFQYFLGELLMRCATRFVAALAAVAVVGYASTASAVQYIVDTNLSSVAISGQITALGGAIVLPLSPQTPGSNVISLSGDLDVDDLGATLDFTSSSLLGLDQPAPQQPGLGGAAGSAPANAGLSVSGFLSGFAALRDAELSITGTSSFASPNFDLSTLTLTIVSATLDYNVTIAGAGSATITNEALAIPAGSGTLVGDTLTIPVNVTLNLEVDPGLQAFAEVNFTGQVVAVAVPEPGTIAMLGMGIIGLVAVGRRRFRKA